MDRYSDKTFKEALCKIDMHEFASVSMITACKTWKCNHQPLEQIIFLTVSFYGLPLTKAALILWAAVNFFQFLSQMVFTNCSSFQGINENLPGWEWVHQLTISSMFCAPEYCYFTAFFAFFFQPLVQCYKCLKETGLAFNLHLSENWLRHYQVCLSMCSDQYLFHVSLAKSTKFHKVTTWVDDGSYCRNDLLSDTLGYSYCPLV